jgi:hypothetical protein
MEPIRPSQGSDLERIKDEEQNSGNACLYSIQDGGEALDRRLLG